MANILGLDLGTNSIGWALLNNESKCFIASGSRIIPMDAATIGDYEKGNLQTQMAVRRGFRGTRRLYERSKLRRERILRVLNVLGFLPEQFKSYIDFEKHLGQYNNEEEPLIAYTKDENGKRSFAFENSFNEMLSDFAKHHPETVENGKRIPYDWTIYYLRKKALTAPVTKEELAWIILNFNAKRGYYQLRGEEEDTVDKTKKTEYKKLKVVNVIKGDKDKNNKDRYWYTITFEGGIEVSRPFPFQPYEIGDEKEMIITYSFDKDGNPKKDKNGELIKPKTRIFNADSDGDWTFLKTKTEYDILQSNETVGEYIYQKILNDPTIKVRGRLVRTIERKLFKQELITILNKQAEFHEELRNRDLYDACIHELYRNNELHINTISRKDFTYLFVNDIIYYQRPLKSKKSLINDCPLEHYCYVNKETGEITKKPIKCASKSNPYYQEFRLWQFIQNLRILENEHDDNGKLILNYDCTNTFLKSQNDYSELFDWLNNKKEIKQEQLLKYEKFNIKKNDINKYRWNYVEDKSYPCSDTRAEIVNRLNKICDNKSIDIYHLWHILYSVSDKTELEHALRTFAISSGVNEENFVNAFRSTPPFKSSYGAYSEKAIKRLLPLMRMGKYWNFDDIDIETQQRISTIINGIDDETISKRIQKEGINLTSIESFKGLPEWLASYVVYNKHSEARDITKFENPNDIDSFLNNEFKQGCLRNTIVEQIIGETMRVVRDIWKQYGKVDEIHIELGRDMKQTNEQRKATTNRNNENEYTNLRVKAILQEFTNPDYGIKDVRPFSPIQQDKFKIYENAVLNNEEVPDDILTILKKFREVDASKRPSQKQIERYKLWLEQFYCSPYTGQPIPLSRLFTEDYQIEHIIPKARYYDDSFNNKVICESAVNQDKTNMLAFEYIEAKGGSVINCGNGRNVTILNKKQYEEYIKNHYSKNAKKLKNLLLEDIPDSFVERQMNDSRYIAKEIMRILSNVVRDEGELEATSKYIVPVNGTITTRLKNDWGINDVWNSIVYPRFERLNNKTNSKDFGEWRNIEGKRVFQTSVPLSISKGFQKKRIDHRHHAMDAMVIATATRDIVNLMNNQYAQKEKEKIRYDLRHKLCKNGQFIKLWPTFTQDVKFQLEHIIVTFKQNTRIINKMSNYYQHYINGKKVISKQEGNGWAIRKSLHKATVSAHVNLQKKKTTSLENALKTDWKSICDKDIKKSIVEIINKYGGKYDSKTIIKYFKDRDYKLNGKDISKLEVYYFTDDVSPLSASRVAIDDSFNEKEIEKITDAGIRKILSNHLARYNNPKEAFSPEGIIKMNKDIIDLNGGKDHKPIFKVRKSEALGIKFKVGNKTYNNHKYVEADKGTNLFFAIYEDENGKRYFDSISLKEAIESLKLGLPLANGTNKYGAKILFILSPNDLVYVPEELGIINKTDIKDSKCIYKVVSNSGPQCFFIPESIATPIPMINEKELGPNNKDEKAWNKQMIKKVCYKLQVDRLGNIIKVIGYD